jgi:hypothetical protein
MNLKIILKQDFLPEDIVFRIEELYFTLTTVRSYFSTVKKCSNFEIWRDLLKKNKIVFFQKKSYHENFGWKNVFLNSGTKFWNSNIGFWLLMYMKFNVAKVFIREH